MEEVIQEKLKKIVNPGSQATLWDEGRILEIKPKEEKLEITYKRDGISPEQKRQIEHDIYACLEDTYKKDQVFVYTKSDNHEIHLPADQAHKKPQESKPAGLAVGHAKPAPKKRLEGVKKVIAIASGKGGVGKSTVATNLALTLNNAGFKVGLVDSDIYGPSIPMLLGQRNAKPVSNDNKKIVPVEAYGLKFMSFGLFVAEEEAVIWRGPMLGGVLKQFLFDVEWGNLDYLIIDLPPGTGDMQLSLVQTLEFDGVVIVSTPQDVAMLDAKKGLKMFQQMNIPIIGLIENMSYFICDGCDKKHFIFGEDGGKNGAQKIGVNFLGQLPLVPEMSYGSDEGLPYMSLKENKKTKLWKEYCDFSNRVSQILGIKPSKGSFLKNIF